MIVCFLFRERDGWSVGSPLTHLLYGQTRTHAKCVYCSILVFRLRQRLSLSPGSWRELTGAPHSDGPILPASPFSNSPPLPTAYHQTANLIFRPFFSCPGRRVVDICMILQSPARHDTTPLRVNLLGMLHFLQRAYNSSIILFTSSSYANVPLKKPAEARLGRSKAHMPAALKPLNRYSRYLHMYLLSCGVP